MQAIKELYTIRETYRTVMEDIIIFNQDMEGTLTNLAISEKTIMDAKILGKTIVSNIRRMGEGLDRILTKELLAITEINKIMDTVEGDTIDERNKNNLENDKE